MFFKRVHYQQQKSNSIVMSCDRFLIFMKKFKKIYVIQLMKHYLTRDLIFFKFFIFFILTQKKYFQQRRIILNLRVINHFFKKFVWYYFHHLSCFYTLMSLKRPINKLAVIDIFNNRTIQLIKT